jgi:hypothetical protein
LREFPAFQKRNRLYISRDIPFLVTRQLFDSSLFIGADGGFHSTSSIFYSQLTCLRTACYFYFDIWMLPYVLPTLIVSGKKIDLVFCLIWGVSLCPSNFVGRLCLFCFVCSYYFLVLCLGSGKSTICRVYTNNGKFRYSLMLV